MAQRRTPPAAPNLEMIRIVLVEPSPVTSLGMREVLDGQPDMEIVGEVRSASAALAAVEQSEPDVVLMDVELGEPIANAAARRLTHDAPGSAVVIVGGGDDDASIMGAFGVGATGHVGAAAEAAELVAVIRRSADGEYPLRDKVIARPDLVDKIVETFREGFRRQDEPLEIPLTPRELDILRYVAGGQKNRQIAEQLDLNEQTVKNHLSSIMHKLGVPNRTHAVTFAVRQGWLSLDVGTDAFDRDAGDAAAEPSTAGRH